MIPPILHHPIFVPYHGAWVIRDCVPWPRMKCYPNCAGTLPPLTSKCPHFLFVHKVAFQKEEPDSGRKKTGLLLVRSETQWRSQMKRAPGHPKIKETRAFGGGGLLQTVIIKVTFCKCLRQKVDRLWVRPQPQRHTPGGEMALAENMNLITAAC